MGVRGWFKLFLDEEILKGSLDTYESDLMTIDDVRMWYTHFLTALYEHIASYLQGPPWWVDLGSTNVDYIFSLPTSWKDKSKLTEDFKGIAKLAGFGRRENCSLTIGLTEGEASAVYTAASLEHRYRVSQLYAKTTVYTY
jgi:hypothetical protein